MKGDEELDDSQLLRGVLEGCILAIIARGETYGYEILAELEKVGFEGLLEGTLYPVLTRLEKKHLITCRKGKSPYGPIRKYYSITEEGTQYFEEFQISYERISNSARKILSGESAEEKGDRL